MTADRSALRQSLLPSMLQTVWENLRHQERVALFEIAKVYLPGAGMLPEEPLRLSLALSGRRWSASWATPAEEFDFFDLKGVVEAIGRTLHVGLVFRPIEHPSYHPGRCAEVQARVEDRAARRIGVFGQVHPVVSERFDLGRAVYAGELDMQALIECARDIPAVQSPPRFPAVELDLAVAVQERVPVGDVEAAICAAGGALLERARLFDVYRGAPIPEGWKSLAFSLTIRAADRTLTDDEAVAVRSAIESHLIAEFGAHIRGR